MHVLPFRVKMMFIYFVCKGCRDVKKSGTLFKDNKGVEIIHFEAAKSLSGNNGEPNVDQQTQIGCSIFCDISWGL